MRETHLLAAEAEERQKTAKMARARMAMSRDMLETEYANLGGQNVIQILNRYSTINNAGNV